MDENKIQAGFTGEQLDNFVRAVDSPNRHHSENKGPVRQEDYEPRIPMVDSSRLFGEKKEIMIRHEGTIYRLRITKNDKLIMNK